MKTLHQLGHKHNWNIDLFFNNDVGDGFIFGAFNIEREKFYGAKLSGYNLDTIIKSSFIDLQYYGKTKSKDLGKLNTYPFHPARISKNTETELYANSCIRKGIEFQHKLGLSKIIIPNFCFKSNIKYNKKNIFDINDIITKVSEKGNEYYLTLAFTKTIIQDPDIIEIILSYLTHSNIIFDGYYIVCEPILEYKQKLIIDYDYFENMMKIFAVLKRHNFKIIYGYANLESIIFASLIDFDYISIGSYENLRSFNLARYTRKETGGPSKGWYFSEKLLNFIKAQELQKIRGNSCLPLIRNDDNIFSDIVLNEGYEWNTHKPDVHKNYLLEIDKLINNITKINNISQRIVYTMELIQNAIDKYRELSKNKVFLIDESSDYHLDFWLKFLKSKL